MPDGPGFDFKIKRLPVFEIGNHLMGLKNLGVFEMKRGTNFPISCPHYNIIIIYVGLVLEQEGVNILHNIVSSSRIENRY